MSLYNTKNDDTAMNDESALGMGNPLKQTCRICLESSNSEELISLCKCAGSIEYVHEQCIKAWILFREKDIDNAKCEICNTKILMNYCKDSNLAFSNIWKDGRQAIASLICCVISLLILVGIILFLAYGISSSIIPKNNNFISLIVFCGIFVLGLVIFTARKTFLMMKKTKINNWKIWPQTFEQKTQERRPNSTELPYHDKENIGHRQTMSI